MKTDPGFATPHWTDTASAPVFETRIHKGNIFEMAGTAGSYLRHIGVPADRISKMYADVTGADSYEAACAVIARWFPVDDDDE